MYITNPERNRAIVKMYNDGYLVKDIARAYKMSTATIHRILLGEGDLSAIIKKLKQRLIGRGNTANIISKHDILQITTVEGFNRLMNEGLLEETGWFQGQIYYKILSPDSNVKQL